MKQTGPIYKLIKICLSYIYEYNILLFLSTMSRSLSTSYERRHVSRTNSRDGRPPRIHPWEATPSTKLCGLVTVD
jgi:hypothetical protein